MSKIPVDIGELTFATKSQAGRHFKEMLNRYSIGSRILELDAMQLGCLLTRHPEFKDKLGVGIEHFSVRNAIHGTRCFEIVRRDGSATDFSYKVCVDGKAPSALQEAIRALRAEVEEDILQKKRDWFTSHGNAEGKVPCALTGRLITIEEAHAAHAPPRLFATLAITFLEARGIDPSAGFVTPYGDNQYQPRIMNRTLAEEWRAYHHELAVIRVVAKDANLQRAHEGKVKSKDKQLRLK